MNKLWKNKLESLVPPGFPLSNEINTYLTGLILATVYSLAYFIQLFSEYNQLFRYNGNTRELIKGIFMPQFYQILGNFHAGYFLLSAAMLCFIVGHYTYFHMGNSHPLYLMKRIPDGKELHRRCCTLPLLSILITLSIPLLLTPLYYGAYLLITPEECLIPGQSLLPF